MKAAVLKAKGLFSIEDVPVPKAGPGEVVIKVTYCSSCGSDQDRWFFGRGIGLILGHEFSGTISEIGTGVTGWAIGDRVVVDPVVTCNKCYWCLHGQRNLCLNRGGTGVAGGGPGAFAQYAKAEKGQLFHIPNELGDKEASLAQTLAVALHAVRISGIKLGDSVAILGGDPIGLTVLQCARLAGASKIYVSEEDSRRKAIAEQLGADAVFNPAEVNVPEHVSKLTGVGADVVIVWSGSPGGVLDSLKMARKGGTVVVMARWEKAEISPDVVQDKELIIKGAHTYGDEFGIGVDLLSQGKINASILMPEITSLDDIQDTFKKLEGLIFPAKVLIVP